MTTLIDWILDLFRNEDAARAFVAAPEQALRDAGLAGVSAAQLASVAATAVPGLVLGGGDPIVGLQRAVSNQYGFAPAYAPSLDPIYAPSPTFAPETNTDLASHNDTSLLSPDQDAGANAQQGAFNLGFGDITLGDKTTNTATNGGVVVAGDNDGDIVSGDGAVLGNDNDVNNGDVLAGTGIQRRDRARQRSKTTAPPRPAAAPSSSDNDGTVLHDVDASGGNGGGAGGSGGGLIGHRRRHNSRRQRRRRRHHRHQYDTVDQQRQHRDSPSQLRRQPRRDTRVRTTPTTRCTRPRSPTPRPTRPPRVRQQP